MTDESDKAALEALGRIEDSMYGKFVETYKDSQFMPHIDIATIRAALSAEAKGAQGEAEWRSIGEDACSRYVDWYEHGISADGGNVAYDMVTSIRHMLAAPPAAVPHGWKLVPVEPTAEMLTRGWNESRHELSGSPAARAMWRSMLAAAGEPK